MTIPTIVIPVVMSKVKLAGKLKRHPCLIKKDKEEKRKRLNVEI